MLISHKHKFISIDVPKTGTTSINSALHDVLGANDFTLKMSRDIKMRHATYEQCMEKFPGFENYFVFAFVRNPWDRIISYWFWAKYNAKDLRIDKNLSLKDFLQKTPQNQYSYIKGFTNNSFVGRFENLQQDFDEACDKIGISRQELRHVNKTNHKHYTEYYDDEMREIVAKKYARDIEYFGYKFGE